MTAKKKRHRTVSKVRVSVFINVIRKLLVTEDSFVDDIGGISSFHLSFVRMEANFGGKRTPPVFMDHPVYTIQTVSSICSCLKIIGEKPTVYR